MLLLSAYPFPNQRLYYETAKCVSKFEYEHICESVAFALFVVSGWLTANANRYE